MSHSEDDICRMFAVALASLGQPRSDPFPPDLAAEQAQLSKFIYEKVNNGVYRAGFATRQHSYERAAHALFAALDELESRLTNLRYFFGDRIVESDWRLFCTLIRLAVVYYTHFKCQSAVHHRLPQPARLSARSVSAAWHRGDCRVGLFQAPLHMTHDAINPTRLVPIGPIP